MGCAVRWVGEQVRVREEGKEEEAEAEVRDEYFVRAYFPFFPFFFYYPRSPRYAWLVWCAKE